MADDIDDGGPAFPVDCAGTGVQGMPRIPGMTLRDWFAGQALASGLDGNAESWEILAWFGRNAAGITKQQIVSRRAYDIADEMLRARETI